MSSERHQRVKEIFLDVCDLAPSERGRVLDERCGGDAGLRAEVERMLGLDAASIAERLDESPAGGAFGAAAFGEGRPDRVGRYEVIREIGRGGMGVVYEARQENPSRSVALKVLHSAYAGGKVLRRFELEAQLLGQLEHPGIARVYEAGSVEAGGSSLPFIAMELIDGPSLTEYAEAHKLGRAERLELLARVCDAVHHAHQRGVIHRDLKPANILVATGHATTRADARFAGLGQPKVLDFGVARAAGLETQVTTIQTGEAQLIGTIAYMSPEQVAGDPAAIDIRSDVYALGVVLFELLTGRQPHDLSNCTMFEAVRRIREDEPDRAATADRSLRGDVDTIVSKALEREADRRYQTAAELADDLRRFLRSEPIVARRASTVYQLRKFARRNKALVTGVAVAFVGMALGTGVSVWKAVDATRQRDRAVEANRVAGAVNTFLNEDILRSASPKRLGREVTVREAVDVAVLTIGARFRDDPVVESRVRHSAGQTYASLGEFDKARQQLTLSIGLLEPIAPEHDDALINARSELAKTLMELGEAEESQRLARENLDTAVRAHGEWSRAAAYAMDAIALIELQQGRLTEAIELTERQIEIMTELDGAEHPDTLIVRSRLASTFIYSEQPERAEQALTELIEIQGRVMGEEHPNTFGTRANLASLYLRTGRYAEAEAIYVELLPLEERVLGSDHPSVQITRGNLGVVYNRTRRYDLARPLMEKTLRTQIESLGDRNPNVIVGMANFSLVCFNMGDHGAALEWADRALPACLEILGERHPVTAELLYNRARPLRGLGRFGESAEAYTELIDLTIRTRGETHPRVMHFSREMAQVLTQAERYEEAESRLGYAAALVEQRDEAGEQTPPAIPAGIRRAYRELYTAWGRPDDAARHAEPEAETGSP